MRQVLYFFTTAICCLSASFHALYASSLFHGSDIWSLWDSIQLAVCKQSSPPPTWSPEFVVFRASRQRDDDSRYGLDHINAGNMAGELHFLLNQQAQINQSQDSARHRFVTAYLIRVNGSLISDYFHCEKGDCEFRQTGFDGLVRTPLAAISSPYLRVGIKERVNSSQISHCRLGRPCYHDVCLALADSQKRLAHCIDQSLPATDCYFAFTDTGEGYSYEILGKTEPATIDWQGDLAGFLAELAASL